MSIKDSLFNDFPSISSKQWKQKIQFDLKGADYNETLITETLEGINIKPFYHNDSFKQLDIPENDEEFKICQTIFISNDQTANFLAKDALKRGADSIQFIADKKFDFKIVLDDISNVTIYFQLLFLDKEFVFDLINSSGTLKVYLNIDLIGNLVKTGNWFYNNQKDHEILKSILKKETDTSSALGVDVSVYQNAGANTVQQVAYALAHVNEYLNFIHNNEINLVKDINFTFSIGSNYFFEIAKLRAFKYLWKLLLKEYNFNINANLFTQPTLRNKTVYDYNVNMLRTTSESMSAILGGAHVLSNASYDTIFHKKNEFGERIARNQLIVLKEESYLKNNATVHGSYYIEELTFEIANKALKTFKEIEKSGGFVKQLFEGTIQRKINENAQKEQDLFDKGELVLLGTNMHTNLKDRMNQELEIYPFVKKKNHQTIIQPIRAKRLAEKLELNRLKSE